MILLDTSFLSHVFRRKAPSATGDRAIAAYERLVQQGAPLAIPALAAQEVLSGLRTESEFFRMSEILDGFSIVVSTKDDHWLAAAIFNTCAAQGIAVSAVDCLISAQAIAVMAELAIFDEDFERISKCTKLRLLPI